MNALAVNTSMPNVARTPIPLDYAFVHKKPRLTPLAKLMESYNGGRGISDNELARKTGVPQPTISRIASGRTIEPKEGNLRALALFFGKTTAELRGEPAPTASRTARNPAKLSLSGKYPKLPSEEALEVARAWDDLPEERKELYRSLIFTDAALQHVVPPWFRFGAPRSANYGRFIESVVADKDKARNKRQ